MLLSDSDAATQQIRNSVAQAISQTDNPYETLYARLSTQEFAASARAELIAEFDAALAQPVPDIAKAHDLSALLTEWPVEEDDAAKSCLLN